MVKIIKIFVVVFIIILLFYMLTCYSFVTSAPVIIGHRGSKVGVENTIQAIQGAIDQGADYAEIDIRLSKDGVPMVYHDNTLFRLTGKNTYFYEYTAEELQSLTLYQGEYNSRIVTLEEVCKFARGKIKLLIEYKIHGKEEVSIVDKTMEIIKKNKMESNVIIQTMQYSLVEEIKMKYPNIPVRIYYINTISRYYYRCFEKHRC